MASYDYIIVGGGLAGLVLAARLTEDSSKRVLVLEAGEDLTADARTSVPAMWPTLLNTDADWKFRTAAQVRDDQLLNKSAVLLLGILTIVSGWLQQP